MDNIVDVWSAANATENAELINLCLPLVTANFAELYQIKKFLTNTTSTSFKTILERISQETITEDIKIQAISQWLDASYNKRELDERICDVKTLISLVKLTAVSRAVLTQIWHSGRVNGSIQHCRGYLIRAWNQAQLTNQATDGALECANPKCKSTILIYGWEKSTKSWVISSIPQLQPEKSVNIRVPYNGEAVVCTGKVFIFGGYNTKDSLLAVDLSNGNITINPPVALQPRNEYSSAVKDDAIFLFGGYYSGKCLSICEKFDITNNMITSLPNLLNKRYGSSALNIPGMGIVVVGGCDEVGSAYPTLRNVEMLIENDNEEGGMKWIEFSPMLKERYRPGIAFFQGCIIVAGGDVNFSIECYPLATTEQEMPQWTFLDGIDGYGLSGISLVRFNDRLLLSKDISIKTGNGKKHKMGLKIVLSRNDMSQMETDRPESGLGPPQPMRWL
ncbi:hypothetical protein Aperf_G00000100702 [Anoplocephala perfoliata]